MEGEDLETVPLDTTPSPTVQAVVTQLRISSSSALFDQDLPQPPQYEFAQPPASFADPIANIQAVEETIEVSTVVIHPESSEPLWALTDSTTSSTQQSQQQSQQQAPQSQEQQAIESQPEEPELRVLPPQEQTFIVDPNYGKYIIPESTRDMPTGNWPAGSMLPSAWKPPSTVTLNAKLTEDLSRKSTVKRVSYYINSNGSDGRHGQIGVHGHHGHDGQSGGPGQDGGAGQDGGNGGDGSDGAEGQLAPHCTVVARGSPHELVLSGFCALTTNIGEDDSILLISCRGGDGGNGGDGGHGGTGGPGGDGGHGIAGTQGAQGQRGNPGGRGGNGGNGGRGGSGGRGGNGGHGARGGSVVVQVADSRLLAFIEADVSGGSGGKPGYEGFGGVGGDGGKGGAGGAGGPPGPQGSGQGSPGPNGLTGQRGPSGNSGLPGQRLGVHGQPGSVVWMITDINNMPLYHSNRKFYPVVESYTLRNVVNDFIFEPGQEILIESISIVNSGGLPLPAGAILSLTSPDGTVIPNTSCELPEIPPDSRLFINPNLVAQLKDVLSPVIPGRFQARASFSTEISLMGRSFPASYKGSDVTVQWPLHIEHLDCPKQAAKSETIVLTASMVNISGLVYGNESSKSVKLNWTLDKRLKPTNYEYALLVAAGQPIVINVNSINPQQLAKYSVEVTIDEEVDYYEQLGWSVGLVLRDKVIEISSSFVRIAATYDASSEPKDALLITGAHTVRREYLQWRHLFAGLGLEVDVWDLTYNYGISKDERSGERHSNSFLGRYHDKLIVFPINNIKYFNLWDGLDLIDHFFHGYSATTYNALERSNRNLPESGILISGVASKPLMDKLYESSKDIVKLTDSFSAVHHFFSPNDADAQSKAVELLQEIEGRFPLNMHKIKSVKFEPEKKNGKWFYGVVDIVTNPIPKTSHLLVLPGLSSIAEDVFDPLETNMIPLTSSYFQALLATISGLPTMRKMRLLLSDSIPAKNWMFTSAKDKPRPFHEVVNACLYDDLKTEFFVKDENLTRIQLLVSFVDECTPVIAQKLAKHLFGLLARLQNATRWHVAPFTKAAAIRDIYFKSEQKLELAMEQKHGCTKDQVKKMKAEGREEGEASSRLKLREIMAYECPNRFTEVPSWF